MKKTTRRHIDLRILDPRLKASPPGYATAGSAGLDLRREIGRASCRERV